MTRRVVRRMTRKRREREAYVMAKRKASKCEDDINDGPDCS